MNITEKIIYFTQTKWCTPFRDLHHSVCEICERVKPICPEIEPNKYLEYFLNNIDFDNIDKSPTKEEGLNNFTFLYIGLDQLLKSDIVNAISKFQMNLSGFRFRELVEIQNTLIDLCGLLERESRTNKPGISFAQRFNSLYKSIESKEKLFPIDYQILIREFNEVILNELLSSYKILNDTLNIKFPIPIEDKIALHKASQKINEFRKKYNSQIDSLRPFLLSKGLIIPKDAEAFLFWLLDEKYKQESFFPLPEITDIDFIEFSRYRESQFDGIEADQQPKQKLADLSAPKAESLNQVNMINETWKQLINPIILESLLPNVESKIQSKIENWKQGINLIECAAFCEIMFDKKWFNKGLTNRKAPNQFALSKYGANIENQLKTSKAKNRNTHKLRLQRYFS